MKLIASPNLESQKLKEQTSDPAVDLGGLSANLSGPEPLPWTVKKPEQLTPAFRWVSYVVAARAGFCFLSGGLSPEIPARRFSVGINSVPTADLGTKSLEKTRVALTGCQRVKGKSSSQIIQRTGSEEDTPFKPVLPDRHSLLA